MTSAKLKSSKKPLRDDTTADFLARGGVIKVLPPSIVDGFFAPVYVPTKHRGQGGRRRSAKD